MTTAVEEGVVARFAAAAREALGGRVARIVLFGSRARGDARSDSDYDIAVFLNGRPNWAADRHLLADVCHDLLQETGATLNALPFSIEALSARTILMHDVRKDGIEF